MLAKFIFFGVFLLILPLKADTILWNESVDGSLDTSVPLSSTFTIHPVGSTSRGVDLIEGSGTIVADGGNFTATGDAFSFTVPQGLKVSDLALTFSGNYPAAALIGLWSTSTGAYDGTGSLLGSGLEFSRPGTYEILPLTSVDNLGSGEYSMAVYTETSLLNGSQLSGTGTMNYTVSLETVPEPRSVLLLEIAALLFLVIRYVRVQKA